MSNIELFKKAISQFYKNSEPNQFCEKINSVFQKNNPKTITQTKNTHEVTNIKLNSSTIAKIMGKGNKKFR